MVPYFLNSNLAQSGEIFKRSDAFFPKIFNNTGNSYITYAMARQVGMDVSALGASNSFASLYEAPVSAGECARIDREFTHVFLTLQDHLREDFDDRFYENACATLERLTLPLIVYSLGANSMNGYDPWLHRKLSPVKKRFIAMLAERCASLGVRGEYTASVLEKLGVTNYTIIGCPTYFAQGSARHIGKKPWDEARALVGATGNYTHAQTQRLYYLLQDELLVSKLRYFADAPSAQDWEHFATPMLRDPAYLDGVMQALARGHIGLFADMELWRSVIRTKLHFVIGSRLHGAIMALNAGVPAIVTNGDARATETCAFLNIPHHPSSARLPKRLQDIYAQIDCDAINRPYGALYDTFKGWLSVNGLDAARDPASVTADAHLPAAVQTCSIAQQLVRKQQMDEVMQFCRGRGRSMRRYLGVAAGVTKRALQHMPLAVFLFL